MSAPLPCPSLPRGGYRPREAFASPLWRILSDHLDTFLRRYETRYAHTHGPLAPHVEKVANQFLRCGDPNAGVAILRCPKCGLRVAVPRSCKTKLCPSCVNRRAEELSITLLERLPHVPYRHITVTFPIMMGIRTRLHRDPDLRRRVVRLVVGVLRRYLVSQVKLHRNRRDRAEGALPGFIVAMQGFGDQLTVHPHLHILAADGVWLSDGTFYPYLRWDALELSALVRRSVVASFVALGLMEPETAERMLALPVERCGFRVHVERKLGEAGVPGPSPGGPPDDQREELGKLVRYLVRPPVALDRLQYIEATGQVRYRTRKGALLDYRNPLDFLADLFQHLPPFRRQALSYHGWLANSTGHLGPGSRPDGAAAGSRTHCRRVPWAQLVARTWAVDPEICRCGARMVRSKALVERHQLVPVLEALRILGYPARPPPAQPSDDPPRTYGGLHQRWRPNPAEQHRPADHAVPSTPADEWADDINQAPPGWETAPDW